MFLEVENSSEQAEQKLNPEQLREWSSFEMFEGSAIDHDENGDKIKNRIGIPHYAENLCQFYKSVLYWRAKLQRLLMLPDPELEARLTALQERIEQMIKPLLGSHIRWVEEESPDQPTEESDPQ